MTKLILKKQFDEFLIKHKDNTYSIYEKIINFAEGNVNMLNLAYQLNYPITQTDLYESIKKKNLWAFQFLIQNYITMPDSILEICCVWDSKDILRFIWSYVKDQFQYEFLLKAIYHGSQDVVDFLYSQDIQIDLSKQKYIWMQKHNCYLYLKQIYQCILSQFTTEEEKQRFQEQFTITFSSSLILQDSDENQNHERKICREKTTYLINKFVYQLV